MTDLRTSDPRKERICNLQEHLFSIRSLGFFVWTTSCIPSKSFINRFTLKYHNNRWRRFATLQSAHHGDIETPVSGAALSCFFLT